MSRSKILICGSLGFLMSNFIRYLMYRTKNYDIISLDRISNEKDIKRLYFNRSHVFHVGDITDDKYLNRLITLSKPDIIINGVNSDDPTTVVTGTWNLINLDIPIIQIVPNLKTQDKFGWWESSHKMIQNSGNCTLECPDCFGTWQRTCFGFAKIIKQVSEETCDSFDEKVKPWAYSEDISSVIWFLMESMLEVKNQKAKHVRAPVIGKFSDIQLALMVQELIGNDNRKELRSFLSGEDTPFEARGIAEWSSDTPSPEWAIEKTIRWYLSNKWALCL